MLKIGEFSKLTRVSIRMLRHYDELNLLKPAHVDPESGYRYYTYAQLPRLTRILTLSDLGFSLEQVGRMLSEDLNVDEMRAMLRLRQAELQDKVAAEQERLNRIEARIRLIEAEGREPDHDVLVKEIEPQLVASIRGSISTYAGIGSLFDPLFAYVMPFGVSTIIGAIWHDDSHPEAEIDAEAMTFLRGSVPPTGQIRVYEQPAMTVASVIHRGGFDTITTAYNAIMHWLDHHDYRIAAPNRELYLQYDPASPSGAETNITEIQFPIARP